MMQKVNIFLRQFSTVFFGSRKAAFVSSLVSIAIAALLYIVYLQIKEAAHIELPTGLVDIKTTKSSTTLFKASQEILVLNSYHRGHAWSDNETAGILEILQEASPNIRYNIEYLDCKYHPKAEHFEAVKDLFKLKYANRDIPVVIVTDNPALEFVLKYRSLLFPRSSIVFCGINNYKKEMIEGQENITGLAEALDAGNTVKTALKLHPKAREVFVVHDYTTTGLATRREAEEQIKGMFDQISFRYAEDMTKKELTQRLEKLPQDSLVLALTYNVFRDGEVITHENLARLLSANSPVPVYGVHNERLGYGIVGGSLLSGKLHGSQAARIALKILSGLPASNIPVDMSPQTRVMFDYNQLVRFGVPIKDLPEDSVVVNRPVSFISSHKYLVLSTLLVIIILTSGIIILGSNLYRRELAEDALRKSKEELEMRVTGRTAELKNANEQLHFELTERKRAQELLELSEHRLSEAQRIAHVGSWELDLLKNELTWSDEIYRIFGLPPQEFGATYEAFLDAVHPDDRDYVNSSYTCSVERDVPYDIMHRIVRKSNGEVRYVHEKCEHTRDASGRIVKSVGTVQDITELKQAEEALRQRESELNESQRLAHIGSWDWNATTDTIWWSDEYYRIYNLDPKLPPPNYIEHLKVYTSESAARLDPAVKRSMETGEPYELDLELADPSAATRWIVARGEAKRDASSRIWGLRGTAQNITERKMAEEKIRRLNEELEQRVITRTADLEKMSLELQDSQRALMNIVDDLNRKTLELEDANNKLKELDRLKSMFIASMSHELRTPLNSIIGFSSVLHDGWIGQVNAEQKENLATILRSGKHLLSLINDVIDVSKIESGKIEITHEDFDVYDVVSEAVELFKKDIQDKGLDLKVEPIHLAVHTDRRRLLQCLVNLISNAIKFTEKGSVRVTAKLIRSSEWIEISVEDTGIGIREEDLTRLFRAFVRLHSPLSTSVKGTGLGLSLTKKIVTEVLGGEISAQSVYGKGSRFVIRIPVKLKVEAGK